MLARVSCQQVQIGLPVFVIEEDRGAVVAALGDVVGMAGGDDASNSWHMRTLAQSGGQRKGK